MTRDNAKAAPPPGMLLAALVLLAGAAVGAVMAVNHSSTLYLVLGIVLFILCAFLGVVFLYAWFKGRNQT
ncbi:hypothetical protein ACIRSS_07400 [Amycolatopsis sp. NPDC101161]|uniref:hypothetical protein n=1 Tax=Amycolatopsis sp. NPDC101161 TaxID=3363940 RepID=UPI003811A76E